MMHFIHLNHFVWLLLLFIFMNAESRPNKNLGSLEVLVPLINESYSEGTEDINLSCEVQNATVYSWYIDRKQLMCKQSCQISKNKLMIKYFSQQYVGVYECIGEDKDGLTGRSVARISMKDPCGPQKGVETHCVTFTREMCPLLKSFAPRPEGLKVIYKVDNDHDYKIQLEITWQVPKQGITKETLWAWQIRVFCLNKPCIHTCAQINREDILNSNIKVEKKIISVPFVHTKYHVEVQSLPSLEEPHNESVASEIVNVPDWCTLRGSRYPCCDMAAHGSYGYINASISDRSNGTVAISWTTNYPPSMDISIEGYLVKWISNPNDRCHADLIVLNGRHHSSYNISDLQLSCGNYSLKVEVIFMHPERVGCKYSPAAILHYDPSLPGARSTTAEPSAQSNPKQVWMTSGLAIAAGAIAVLVIVLVVKFRRRKEYEHVPPSNLIPVENDVTNVFVINPNRCNLCNDVIHKLASLLMTTGHIQCTADMFVPDREKTGGPLTWNIETMQQSRNVLVPFLTCKNHSGAASTQDSVATFRHLLNAVEAECCTRTISSKYFAVYLDHCEASTVIPAHLRNILPSYGIPSYIDDLIFALIGETVRQPDGSILQFNHPEYINAKEQLHNVVDEMKKRHCNRN